MMCIRYTVLIITMSFCAVVHSSQMTMPVPVGTYGQVVSRSVSDFDNAVTEKVIINSKENENSDTMIKRRGILVRYPNAVGTFLLCHGFMCDKHDQGFLRRLFPRGKYNTLSFDFRAHGDDKDFQKCTLGKDEAYDVIAAANFIKNHPDLKDSKLFVYGMSMGAVAAIEAQAKQPHLFKAMVLDAPFDSTENVLKRGLANLKFSLFGYKFDLPGKKLLEQYAFHPYIQSVVATVLKTFGNLKTRDIPLCVTQFNPVETVSKITVPSLFILCKKDEKVSVDAMKSIYNNISSSYKMLWLTNGRHHCDSYFYNPEKYTSHVRNFLEKAADGSLYKETFDKIVEDVEEMV